MPFATRAVSSGLCRGSRSFRWSHSPGGGDGIPRRRPTIQAAGNYRHVRACAAPAAPATCAACCVVAVAAATCTNGAVAATCAAFYVVTDPPSTCAACCVVAAAPADTISAAARAFAFADDFRRRNRPLTNGLCIFIAVVEPIAGSLFFAAAPERRPKAEFGRRPMATGEHAIRVGSVPS